MTVTAARCSCSGSIALGLGVLEALLIFLRRWSQIKPVLGLETAIRDDVYAHLQRLPMSFHGDWQSGQMLSRITTDLSTIRRFLGFGMLFLVMNILQLIVVTALLLSKHWPLGLLVAASAVPIVMLSMRFEKRYIKISRQVQDEQGDLGHVRRGVGDRHPDHQGLRPPPPCVRELRQGRGQGLRHLHGQGAAVGPLLHLPGGDPELHARAGAAAGRAGGRRRAR